MYDATYKIVIFGDAGCGKTTLTQRFLTSERLHFCVVRDEGSVLAVFFIPNSIAKATHTTPIIKPTMNNTISILVSTLNKVYLIS